MSIASNINTILASLKPGVRLVTISKTKSVEEIRQAYDVGQRAFGENKVQELVPKHEQLPADIEWHFIGHLQGNKVKYIAPFIHTIQSVDSLELLKEINKQAKKHSRIIKCFLQVHIAREETKFGLSEQELFEMTESPDLMTFQNVSIAGLMGMATYTEDKVQIRNEFRYLANIRQKLKETTFAHHPVFTELSMGMSSDYAIAVEEGSTIIRIGSNIFGERY